MLEEVRIRGLGVIEDATLELGPGLTVVTGETGAGKTMVVSGLSLLFGGRADTGRVTGTDGRASVDGRLRVAPDSVVHERALDAGAEPDDDGSFILTRTLTAEGRSRAHLGGRTVPVSVLGELAERALAMHGQSDQMRLMRPAEQRGLLDRFAGSGVTKPLDAYSAAYETWQRLSAELEERTGQIRERAQEADLLRHGLAEIAAVEPVSGEDTDLEAEAGRLGNVETLRQAAAAAHEALVGDPAADGGAADASSMVGAARRALDGSGELDPTLTGLGERLAEVGYLLSDVAGDLSSYLDTLDADPARLEQVLDRRAALTRLTRKYADTVDGVLAWAETAEARLADLDTSDETMARLRDERDAAAADAAKWAAEVSAARRAAAEAFGTAVSAELAGLAMPNATVAAEVRHRKPTDNVPTLEVDGQPVGAGPDGADEVEILLVAHPGAPARPVQRGASGGELSRVMLAIEVVFAAADPVPTMVFDEVDAGVGGQAAVEVGRRLARLAATHQVVVVTHLAQVAAYADRHLVVDKSAEPGGSAGTAVTRSDVRRLDGPDRVRELARMLAGSQGSEVGAAHAEELLARAATDREAVASSDGGSDAAGQPSAGRRKKARASAK